MSRQYLSSTMPDEIAGVAWLIEIDHPQLSRAQLARAARRQLDREKSYVHHSTRIALVESSDAGDHVAMLSDSSADTIEMVETRERVARCLTTCRRIDSSLTDAALACLADGASVGHGHDAARVSSRELSRMTGVAESTIRRRMARLGL